MIIIYLLITIVCCHANYGWLKHGKSTKGDHEVLLNPNGGKIETVDFVKKGDLWYVATGSKTKVDYDEYAKDTTGSTSISYKHVQENYFFNKKLKKYAMLMFTDNKDTKPTTKRWISMWVYPQGPYLSQGAEFARKVSKDEAMFKHYITEEYTGHCECDVTSNWRAGAPLYEWLEVNQCDTAIANMKLNKGHREVILRSLGLEDDRWLVIKEGTTKGHTFKHLTKHFFYDEDAKRNVQIRMRSITDQSTVIDETVSDKQEVFAKNMASGAEYTQYIVENKHESPDGFKVIQYSSSSCGTRALAHNHMEMWTKKNQQR